jgi:hypothetical protein
MNEKEKFGEITSEALNVGDIVEWSSWNVEFSDWDVKYGIITEIKTEMKGGRLVSVSKVAPLIGNKIEVEFFTLSLRPVSQTKRDKLKNEFQS